MNKNNTATRFIICCRPWPGDLRVLSGKPVDQPEPKRANRQAQASTRTLQALDMPYRVKRPDQGIMAAGELGHRHAHLP